MMANMAKIKDDALVGLTFFTRHSTLMRVMYAIIAMSFIVTLASGQSVSGVCNAIFGIYSDVETVIFVLALVLIVLGGGLYAGSNLLPSQTKGQIQGYGMSMIIGGVVGILIYFLAPYILTTLGVPNSALNSSTACT